MTDVKTVIVRQANKTILAVFAIASLVAGALFTALQIWPPH